MVVALKPLHDAAGIKRVVVSTYQSVSGAGKEGMDELFEQTRAVFVGDPKENRKFTKQIAFNVIPHIDVFLGPDSGLDGYTKEEWKMRSEEHTSELQSLMRISYAVFCLKKKNKKILQQNTNLTKHQ